MTDFKRSLGLSDAMMIVMGSMIGSGIFLVSADITRTVGSAGYLILIWVITGLMMVSAALSYGELSAMYPKAGGLYIYLKEAYGRLVAFLYGWALFLVIQTGTIAAIGVAFSKFAAYLFPALSEKNILLGDANSMIKLTAAQLTSIVMIVFLTFINARGVQNGRWIQLIFTIAKIGGVAILILFGFYAALNMSNWSLNWQDAWAMNSFTMEGDTLQKTPITGTWAIISTMAIASVGAIFSSFAWDNITFIAGEIQNPKRNIGLSLFLGVSIVMGIYVICNLMYLSVLPLQGIAFAESDRVAVDASKVIFGPIGTYGIAALVMISTFGCNNGLILSSARVFYTMAQEKMFFQSCATLNNKGVPEKALWYQCIWASILCLSGRYGDLLDFVIFAVLLFYALVIIAIFILRKKYPDADRPYKAFGYPIIPILYLVITALICVPLLMYKPNYSWPGLFIVLAGIPVYYLMRNRIETDKQ
jgi:basic amino acid/polyamine antiporter, APA family